MSESYYGLSETEHELMKYFWASDQPLSFCKNIRTLQGTKLWMGTDNTAHLFDPPYKKRSSALRP